MPWTSVLLLETDHARMSLRRYSTDRTKPCPTAYYHNSGTPIDTAPINTDAEGNWHVEYPQPPRDDPRWPTHCACGYSFMEADNWQVSASRIYTRQDTGAELTLDEAEPGMLWEAPWYADVGWHGTDGKSYVMRLPGNGEWPMDAISASGGRWERTGEVPRFTVRPSILSHGTSTVKTYHGFLTDGLLSDDLEGRTYE